MGRLLAGAKAFYGANPLHLVAVLGCFVVTGFAVSHVVDDPLVTTMLIWFVGAVIGHDLVLFPVYALADLTLRGAARVGPRLVSPVNYVRVPALATALTFALFYPGIVQEGQPTYVAATGLTQEPYLVRWLVLVAVLFATSALVYAVRVALVHRPVRRAAAAVRAAVRPGERALAVAGQPLAAVGTDVALYYRDGDGGWARVAWTRVRGSVWSPWDGRLVLQGFPGESPGRVEVRIDGPSRIPELVRARPGRRAVRVRALRLPQGTAVASVGRRRGGGEPVWHVRMTGAVPGPDPATVDALLGDETVPTSAR